MFTIMLAMGYREFSINDKLVLKLEKNKTMIYVTGKPFRQCKYLLLNIPVEEITTLDELDSIDKISETLDHTLEPVNKASSVNEIPPEVEFWGHCSNLHVWYENDYKTEILHSNLAFHLLKNY